LTPEKLVIAILIPVVLAIFGSVSTWWLSRPTTDLEVVGLTVEEGEAVDDEGDGEYELVPPKVQVALRNVGDQVSVVTGARLEVLDHAFFPVCEAGGPLEVSRTYDVPLPLDPDPGQLIGVDVAQDVEPAQADRFEFSMQIPNPQEITGTHLYRLGVSLIRDGSAETLDAGNVIIGAPVLQVETLRVLNDDLSAPGEVGACYRQLRSEYQRVQEWEGKRSVQLANAPDDILVEEAPS
jgi:hypothetical protein